MVLAIIVGYLLGASVTFFVAKRMLQAMGDMLGASAGQRRSMTIVGGLFGAISLAPSIFMAMMIGGGSLAGQYAGAISRAVGLGEAGALPVLSLALMVIITITVTAVVAVGAGMGYLGARSLARNSLPPPRVSR